MNEFIDTTNAILLSFSLSFTIIFYKVKWKLCFGEKVVGFVYKCMENFNFE